MSRIDFRQVLGAAFGSSLCPPLSFEEASPHECYEVLMDVLGDGLMPEQLSALTDREIGVLAARFGEYFEADPPSQEQTAVQGGAPPRAPQGRSSLNTCQFRKTRQAPPLLRMVAQSLLASAWVSRPMRAA